MTTISLRLSDDDSTLIKRYAQMHGVSVSELVRQSVLEKIEDEYDLKAYEKALDDFKKNPITYTLNEVEKELGLK
ncbi:type II toxin-antitoxin system RelB family antitoxin [Anoxynatronum buryatiense]|uniref:CopG family transcriptional regulator n=1 Tax=Anoxynatronum buryatiense TaxID=489973 RepID=A0AA46AK08_9CLOT|nr:DUF6290 family protein [Anoxynatronum buryatiense]SMP65160.1 hypothetical protein SAMN06296020_11272 [Anoxynatronum buryatiense]